MDDFNLHDIADTFPTDVEQGYQSINAAVATLREHLPQLESACAALAPAWEQIADAMHSLHGTSSMVNLTGFAALSGIAENSADMLAQETSNVLHAIPRCHEIIGATTAASQALYDAVPEYFASEQQKNQADHSLQRTAEEWETMWTSMASEDDLESTEFPDERAAETSDPQAFTFAEEAPTPDPLPAEEPAATANSEAFSFGSTPERSSELSQGSDTDTTIAEISVHRDPELASASVDAFSFASPEEISDQSHGDHETGSAKPSATPTAPEPTHEQAFSFGVEPTSVDTAPEPIDEDLLAIFREEYLSVADELDVALQAIAGGQGSDALIATAGRIFHQLKGAAASIGLHANSQAAAYGERICDDPAEAQQLIGELLQLAQDVNPDAAQHDSLNSTDQQAMRATFLGEFNDVAKTITAWLDANTIDQHWEDTQQLLHRLKGSALIVAADDLYPPISSVHDQFASRSLADGLDQHLKAALRELFDRRQRKQPLIHRAPSNRI